MPKKEDDWGELIAGVAGAIIGAGATASTLNGQIQALKAQIGQWQRQALQLQAERDQFAGKAAFAESQLRQSRESEVKLQKEIAELRLALSRSQAKR
jgi:septal ring factor EnvC (AmiA/AmiB activator)